MPVTPLDPPQLTCISKRYQLVVIIQSFMALFIQKLYFSPITALTFSHQLGLRSQFLSIEECNLSPAKFCLWNVEKGGVCEGWIPWVSMYIG